MTWVSLPCIWVSPSSKQDDSSWSRINSGSFPTLGTTQLRCACVEPWRFVFHTGSPSWNGRISGSPLEQKMQPKEEICWSFRHCTKLNEEGTKLSPPLYAANPAAQTYPKEFGPTGPVVIWSTVFLQWMESGWLLGGVQIQFEIVNNALLNHPFLAYICKPTCWVSRFDFSSRTCSCWDSLWSINDPDPKLVYKVGVCSVSRHLFSWENLWHLSVLFVQYNYTTLQF